MANKFDAEAARLQRVYDANQHKNGVANLYDEVSALLDRLDGREGALRDGGQRLFVDVDALCARIRNR